MQPSGVMAWPMTAGLHPVVFKNAEAHAIKQHPLASLRMMSLHGMRDMRHVDGCGRLQGWGSERTVVGSEAQGGGGHGGQGGGEVPPLEGGGQAAAAVQAGGGADALVAPPHQRRAPLQDSHASHNSLDIPG